MDHAGPWPRGHRGQGRAPPHSLFRGKLDLFYEAEFSFARSRRSDLHTLREVVLRDARGQLRENLGWIEQASYFTALVEQTTETETPLPEVFQLVRNGLAELPKRPPTPRTVFAFEFKLLAELGLAPDMAETTLSPGAKHLVQVLAAGDWEMIGRLKLSEVQTRELRQFLHGFILYHLERIPPSRTAALNAS